MKNELEIDWEKVSEFAKWLGLLAFMTLVVALFIAMFYGMYEAEVNRQEPLACEVDRLYSKCIAGIPKGPDATVYNDWAEVISECRKHAREVAPRVHKSKQYANTCEVPK